jgi:two-component system, sensor histidine kinase PdtaS
MDYRAVKILLYIRVVKADDMSTLDLRNGSGLPTLANTNFRTAIGYERELAYHRRTKSQLQEALAREELLLRQKSDFIKQQEILSKESEHRLLNGLQIIASLLSIQSRGAAHADVTSQLAVAAKRVALIGRVHQRLHSLDGLRIVRFRQFIEDFCRDFSAISSFEDGIVVLAGTEIELPSRTAIPLAFVLNELLTNAVKYGKGKIAVSLEASPLKGYAMSVSNDGPSLPEGFDPSSSKGLGMMIIRSFVEKIGGELKIDRCEGGQGARFTVLFS